MSTQRERFKVAMEHAESVLQRPISKSDLARGAGVKPPSVQDWFERDVKLHAEVALRAAAFLRVRPEWLVFGGNEPMTLDGEKIATEEDRAPYVVLTEQEFALLAAFRTQGPHAQAMLLAAAQVMPKGKSAKSDYGPSQGERLAKNNPADRNKGRKDDNTSSEGGAE